MKSIFTKIFFGFVLLNCFYIGYASRVINNASVPKAVIYKLYSMYPRIKPNEVDWMKKVHKFEADFVWENQSVSLVFNKNGEVLESRVEINEKQLPSNVFYLVETNYLNRDYKMIYAIKIKEGETESYEIEVMKGQKVNLIRCNREGILLHNYVFEKIDMMDYNH